MCWLGQRTRTFAYQIRWFRYKCGGKTWTVVRVGADIGIVCRTCGRRVMLTRRDFARGVKRFLERGGPSHDDAGQMAP